MFDYYLDGEVNSSSDFDSFPQEVKATFFNFASEPLTLYWQNPTDDSRISMGDIDPSSSMDLTTFTDHEFIAISLDGKIISPGLISIKSGKFQYNFGEPRAKSTVASKPHPKVKPLNQHSTSMGARFKSLAPAIDIWYEDGAEGSYQGK